MDSFPELKTLRLTLDVPKVQDVPMIVAKAGDPRITRTTLNIPQPYHERDAIFWMNMVWENFKKGSGYMFALRKKEDGIFMGAAGIHIDKPHNRARLGYWMQAEEWGKGYMSEAVAAILAFGFEQIALNRISADYFVENPASGRVMEKCGMILEGEFKDYYKKGTAYLTVRQYRLTREEYETRKSKSP